MRITDHRLLDMSSAASSTNQSRVGDLTDELSTGLRVSKPSQDPTAWLAAQRARVRATLSDGTAQAFETGHDHLTATDGALAQISDIVMSVRALAVQGASDGTTADGRAAIGDEVRGMFSAAVAAGNTRSADGEYLLAGSSSLQEPFDPTTGTYRGDSATRAVTTDAATNQLASIAGSKLTAANGVDVFGTLDRLATALSTNDVATVRSTLADLDTATSQLSRTRSQTGGMMAVLEQARTAHGELATHLATTISNAVEADTAAAASDLAKATQALEVSRAVSSHIVTMLNHTSASG